MSKVTILGAGGWGCALSCVLFENGHQVTVWSPLSDEAKELRLTRENQSKLPGVLLPTGIEITDQLREAVLGRDFIVLATPSIYVRSTAKEVAPYLPKGQILVSVVKGIEDDTLLTMSEIVRQEIPQADVAVLSGPSLAAEVGRHVPTTVVVGASSQKIADAVQDLFMNEVFRVYTSSDMKGIELGGALKNVIALAAGTADGLGLGDNAKAALMTRGIAEITRLGVAAGGQRETFAGLSGIGDLIVTCTSKQSRNHTAGELIGKGATMEEAVTKVNRTVEGINSARAAKALALKYQVSMPIVDEVNRVLFEGKTAKEAMRDLLTRDRKDEFPGIEWK